MMVPHRVGRAQSAPGFLTLAALLLFGCGGEDLDGPSGDAHTTLAGQDASGGTHQRVNLTSDQLRAAGITTFRAIADSAWARVDVPGVVEPPDTARMAVGSIVEGRIEQVLVLEGDEVSAGTALVRIHSHELAEWQGDWLAAQAEVTFAQAALERAHRLLEGGAVARAEVERRQLELSVAQAREAKASEILHHLNPDDQDVVIQAPRAGTVFRIHVGPGEAVLAGAPLVELGSTAVLWVVGQVPEGATPALSRGDSVDVSFPASRGSPGWGRVVALGARVDPVLRTVEVRVQLHSPPGSVRPGSLATLHLPEGQGWEGIRIPALALQEVEGEHLVFVEEGRGSYRPTPVEVLLLEGDVALVEGISEEATVVVQGAYSLRAMLEGLQGRDDEG